MFDIGSGSALTCVMAQRRLPTLPSSRVLVTVKVAGVVRSSSRSKQGRQRLAAARRAWRLSFRRTRSQDGMIVMRGSLQQIARACDIMKMPSAGRADQAPGDGEPEGASPRSFRAGETLLGGADSPAFSGVSCQKN